MRINTNITAIITNRNLQATQDKTTSSLEKLSSGYKINHAADDAAGMAIASKLRAQIRGLEQSSQNASDGISVVQTAEGALNEIESMLQRIRELSVQAANGVYVDEDREAVQAEVNNLMSEIDRISTDTEFNKKRLLNGSLDRRSYTDQNAVKVSYVSNEVPANTYGITILTKGEKAILTGNNMTLAAGDKITEEQEGVIRINDYDIEIKKGDKAEEVFAKITDAADRLNISVTGFSSALSFSTYESGSNEIIEIKISNANLAGALGFQEKQAAAGVDATAEFTMAAVGMGGPARVGFSESATLYCYGNTVKVTDIGNFSLEYSIGEEFTNLGIPINADVTDIGTLTVHIGSNEGQVLDIRIPEVSRKTLGIENINLLTTTGASKAISKLDEAIRMCSQIRSDLGACQNRLDAAVSSLDISVESMNSAISRIEDVDMAEEMSRYTQYNVLSQAGVSMVAQANEMPQMVLQLLQ